MRAIVFSGTSEGKEITEYLNSKRIFTTVCVATDYGKKVMSNMEYVSFHIGRLEQYEILNFIKGFDFVIDATHPYAEIITKNIYSACNKLNIEYIRLLRDEVIINDVIYVRNIEEAVSFLKGTSGNIFVSTGSKEIYKYTLIDDYKNRIVARILPTEESIKKCNEYGFKNIICKKGPFSYLENFNQFKKYNVKWLVTKSSGKSGGFEQKIDAAKSLGINVVIIERPLEKYGLSIDNVKSIIDEKLSTKSNFKFPLFIDISNKNVVVIGGGSVAVRRINTLLKFNAKIKVIAPEFFADDYIKNSVNYVKKPFEPDDINNAFIVIGATNDRNINHNIYDLCKSKGIFCSIADCKEECNFFFPAVCLTNDLCIGIVSDGNNHSYVKEMAEKIRNL